MYEGYFGLIERPFSIAPDPQYLYMSSRHKEAMAHLSYGLSQGGCFIVLTGEVGTGKTTLCRNLLGELPDNVDVALILNANINEAELLQTICDELKINYSDQHSQKQLLDLINQHLLATFADNRHTVLIIDEAQLLSRDVLEQIRLLTNLETTKHKLLQIILIGQPELNQVLSRNDLRQLAQRVTARYHLGALQRNEIEEYVNYRLGVAGCKQPLFSKQALSKLHQLTAGIPRKINVLADHALLATYSQSQASVDAKTINTAAKDVFIESAPGGDSEITMPKISKWWALATLFLLINIGLWYYFSTKNQVPAPQPVTQSIVDDKQLELKPEKIAAADVSAPISVVDENENAEESDLAVSVAELAEPSAGEQDSEVIIENQLTDENSITEITADTVIDGAGSMVVADEPLDASPIIDPASIPTPIAAFNQDTEFGKILETSADLTGRITAFRNLADVWGAELPEQILTSTCEAVGEQGLRCLGVKNWRLLTRYNRPTIMVLKHNDQLHRVIVTSVNEQTADVLVGKATKTLPISELQSRWVNDGLMLWRPAPVGAGILQLGNKSTRLPNVRRYLNRALAQSNLPILTSIDATEFDLEMSQKVFALQTRFGLIGDSVIGYETYLLMNELVMPNSTPTLIDRVR